MRNVLVVLSGPSGVGKGTIAKLLIERNKNMSLSISCTTRAPRINEMNGREYFFVTKEDFRDKIENDGLLEYSEHFENYYGTPKQFVQETLKEKDVILEIDVNGGLKVKENFAGALLIMIAPPSVEEICNRLMKRNTESEEKIKLRMQRLDYELGMSDKYDYVVINDDLTKAVQDIEKIIENEKNK